MFKNIPFDIQFENTHVPYLESIYPVDRDCEDTILDGPIHGKNLESSSHWTTSNIVVLGHVPRFIEDTRSFIDTRSLKIYNGEEKQKLNDTKCVVCARSW